MIINNPQNFNPENPLHIQALGERIGLILAIPELHRGHTEAVPGIVAKLQNFVQMKDGKLQMMSTADDFPAYLEKLFIEFSEMTMFDSGYEAIFDTRKLPLGEDGYDVYTTGNNYQFKKINPGGSIIYGSSAGEKYKVYVEFYGGGAGIDQRLIYTKNFYQIQKDVLKLRNAAFLKKAQVAYGLLDALGAGINIAWTAAIDALASGTAGYTAQRDIATMNLARKTIIGNTKDTVEYYPAGIMGTPFQIIAPYQLEDRIRSAMTYKGVDQSGKLSGAWAKPIYTTLLAASTSYYVVLPKGKITAANHLALQQFMQFNQSNFSNEIADWMSFAFDVGDTNQVARCAIS